MFIFSNLATSLDGKIATQDRSFFYLGTPADRAQMQVLRKNCDAILVGASTLRAFKKTMRVREGKKQPWNVIVSSRLDGISPSWDFFKDPSVKRVLVVSRATPKSRIQKFSGLAEVVLVDPKKSVSAQAVRALKKRGVRRLLVEGGGGVMWDFVKENLINEFHVTLTPWILGGRDAPTLVDGKGFSARFAQKLRLMSVKRLKNEIYLTYRRA